jgi:uroporphyrinogen decarboxylase
MRKQRTDRKRGQSDSPELQVLDPVTGTLGEMAAVVKEVSRRSAGDLLKLGTVFCPLMIARQLGGDKLLLESIREHPKSLHGALELIAETVSAFSEHLLRSGADGIFFAIQSNTPDFMEQSEYAEFGHPYNLRVLHRIESLSGFTLLHACRLHIRFEEFVDYPVHAINWDDRITAPSLAEARRITDKCLVGGIDKEAAFWKGTPAQVREQVREAIESAGSRKLIVGPGCGVPVDSPPENLAALRESAEQPRNGGAIARGK